MNNTNSVETKSEAPLNDRVIYWLRLHIKLIKPSELTKGTGLTRCKINLLLDGKQILTEREALKALNWIAKLSEINL